MTSADPEATPAADGSAIPWRSIAAWVVVVLTTVAVMASVVGLWAHRTLLETDAFMDAVTPAIESENVQALVSDRISDELVTALALEERTAATLQGVEDRLVARLAEALDLSDAAVERLQAGFGLQDLASTISSGIETRIRGVVGQLVSSPEGIDLLLRTTAIAHERTVLLLRDELDQLPNLVVESGEVRLNAVPLMAEVLREVINAGIELIGIDREIPPFETTEDADDAVARFAALIGQDLPPDFGQVPIMSEERLESAQDLLVTFDRATWLVVGATILLAALAIGLAPSLATGLVRVGVAALVGALVGWFAVDLILSGLANGAATPEGRAAIGDIMNAVADAMLGTAVLLAVIGIVVALLGFVLGRRPSPAESGA